MKVGFTGTTSLGHLTGARLARLYEIMMGLPVTEWHHGGARGADELSHGLARADRVRLGRPWYPIHVHPPVIQLKVPKKPLPMGKNDFLYRRKDFGARNQDIVDAAEILVAWPKDRWRAELRSGTWMTVRKAEAKGIEVLFVE